MKSFALLLVLATGAYAQSYAPFTVAPPAPPSYPTAPVIVPVNGGGHYSGVVLPPTTSPDPNYQYPTTVVTGHGAIIVAPIAGGGTYISH